MGVCDPGLIRVLLEVQPQNHQGEGTHIISPGENLELNPPLENIEHRIERMCHL